MSATARFDAIAANPAGLCEEVHLNLAYRWFCRLGLDGKVPDHSTFSKNRHGRFRR
jgi:transposase